MNPNTNSSVRAITLSNETDKERWNAFVSGACLGHLLQSWEWGEFKRSMGWQVQRIGIERDGQISAGTQILFKRLPVLPLTIAYIPKGPVLDLSDQDTTSKLFSAIHRAARAKRAIFLRIEPNMLDDDGVHRLLRRHGFQPIGQTNQPRSTIVIDLAEGEEALLAKMRKTTRKLVRRAARAGVQVVEGETSDLDDLYQAMTSTSETKGIPMHSKSFYDNAWNAFQACDSVKLLLARHKGKAVAAKMIFFFGDKSMHLWGGTSDRARDTNASYLLQWEAIKQAIHRGCRYCDLWGIPDEVGEMLKRGQEIPKERRDGLWGVYTFKRGFGGDIEYYVGAYDYAYWSRLYWLGTKVLGRNKSVDILSTWLEKLSGLSAT